MDIEYYKAQEPIFGFWRIEEELGKGAFGHVFKIKREDFGETYYSALKVISFPQDPSEEESLRAEGMDDMSITSYYNAMVEEMLGEFKILAKLKGNTNIVSYENHMVVDHVNDKGKDILIQMEYLEPLNKYILAKDKDGKPLHKMSANDVVRLAIDICRALEICNEYDIIHRDIKPENIFVSARGDFKLGDFGVARTAGKTKQAMSIKGTLTYMAPEMTKSGVYDATVDIYALGMVIFRLCNGGRAPFIPPAPAPITHHDKDEADIRRLRGEKFPKALCATPAIMEIVDKATAYNPADRYASAALMRKALESIYHESDDNVSGNRAVSSNEMDETLAMPIEMRTGVIPSAFCVPSSGSGSQSDLNSRAVEGSIPGTIGQNFDNKNSGIQSIIYPQTMGVSADKKAEGPIVFSNSTSAPIIFSCSISDEEDIVAVNEGKIADILDAIKAGQATDTHKASDRGVIKVCDLAELEAFESNAMFFAPSDSSEYGVDNYGCAYDRYVYGYHPYDDSFAEYSLKNIDADVFKFGIYLTAKAKKEYDSVLKFNGAQSYIRILCDGKAVFEYKDISKTMEPEEFEINVAGVKFLKIEIAYSFIPAVGIANPIFGKYQ